MAPEGVRAGASGRGRPKTDVPRTFESVHGLGVRPLSRTQSTALIGAYMKQFSPEAHHVLVFDGRECIRQSPGSMKRGILTGQHGFTLLEAMVATLILGFVLSSVLAVGSHCARYLSGIRRTARSSQILQQKLEDIRLLSWSQYQALPATFTDPNDTQGIYSGTISRSTYDTYNGTTTVSRLTLTVTWPGQNGRVLTNTLTTLVSNGGLNKYIF